MATRKVTVTVDEAELERIRHLVAAGEAGSVSGFVADAVGVALNERAEWDGVLTAALVETGGSLTDEERTWADRALGVRPS